MLPYIFQLFFISVSLLHTATAQQFNQLSLLPNHSAQVYYSIGYEQRAAVISGRVDMATSYYEELLNYKPVVTLLILDTADWKKYCIKGAVYGMPHYNNANNTLVVAAQDNPFWKSFLPPLNQLPPALRQQVVTVYSNSDSSLSMQAFFDLLAIHELGHAFTIQSGIKMQRKWMGELYVNILLHTYIAENEPALLPALTLFPQMVVGGGSREFKYTSLSDLENKYDEIARNYPKNYGWYQCRWHAAAAGIYNASGKQVNRKLWDALKSQNELLTDEQLITLLSLYADESVAAVMVNWDKNTTQ